MEPTCFLGRAYGANCLWRQLLYGQSTLTPTLTPHYSGLAHAHAHAVTSPTPSAQCPRPRSDLATRHLVTVGTENRLRCLGFVCSGFSETKGREGGMGGEADGEGQAEGGCREEV